MPTILQGERARVDAIDNGRGFRARANLPGLLLPRHDDHGYGPLAAIMESFLDPGSHIPLHEHVQDEIVSWVPAGVMRHDDPAGGHLVVDAHHLMVMNAGSGFSHEERTREDDPPLRMLQIFVRPPAPGLEPGLQFGRLPEPEPGAWRAVFGPEGGEAPFHVRNRVLCHDLRLAAGEGAILPARAGWGSYFTVFSGRISAEGVAFSEGVSGLVPAARQAQAIALRAEEASVVVAFLIDPEAPVCRGGTVGDGETVRGIAARA